VRRKDTHVYLLCLHNNGYPASLEIRKVYRSIADPGAAARGFVRVIDESGEDYVYPAAWFVALDLPRAAVKAFQAAGEVA
jgi:hypothetical protein